MTVNGKTLGLIDTRRNGDDSLLAATADTPVIVLTSQPEELHRVRLLERGGDDVILKPFSYPEPRARITAVLRRTAPRQPHPVLSARSVRIDMRTRTVTVASRAVELSALEYQLLCVLAAEPTRVFTRQELMATIWGCTSLRGRTLDSHVISSPGWGVGCVDCGFFGPSRRRRFISSGVDSALAAVLSPRAKRRAWALRTFRHPLVTDRSALTSSHIAHRVALPDGREAWTVLAMDGSEVGSAAGFLRYLHRIERSPNTVRAYAHDLKLFWDFLAGRELSWDAVEVADLGDFVAWLRRPAPNVVPLPGVKPARSSATTNRALTAVMGFYEFHARHGVPVAARLVDHSRRGRGSYRPFLYGIAKQSSRARVGRLRTTRELPKVLTLAQIAAVIAAQRRLRDRFLFALLAETGMRVSQALGLRHEDMRTWERRVELVPREDNANGPRGKSARGFAIVSDQLVRLHALYMADEYGLIDSDYVFVNLWAGEIGAPLRYGAVDALVRRTRARVGFDFHPHMFRHTFVTVARRHGMPLDVISKAVGHACVQTTADIYSHLDAEDLRRELAAAGMLDRLGDLV